MFGQTKLHALHGVFKVCLHQHWTPVRFDTTPELQLKHAQKDLWLITCQADFDAGPGPPSPRIRHHSGKNGHLTSHRSLQNTVSPPNGSAGSFRCKPCGQSSSSSPFKEYYLTAKRCAPPTPNQLHHTTFSGRLRHVVTSRP